MTDRQDRIACLEKQIAALRAEERRDRDREMEMEMRHVTIAWLRTIHRHGFRSIEERTAFNAVLDLYNTTLPSWRPSFPLVPVLVDRGRS